jgi:hypothetical protein
LGRDCHRGRRIALQQGTEVPAVNLQQYPVLRTAHGRCVLRLGDQRDLAEELTRLERLDQGFSLSVLSGGEDAERALRDD